MEIISDQIITTLEDQTTMEDLAALIRMVEALLKRETVLDQIITTMEDPAPMIRM